MGNDIYGYAYDTIGSRTATTENTATTEYLANALNQYTAITGRANPSHDLDGNMLDDGAGLAMIWDGENRLIQTVKDGQTVTYAYDYMSRRVAKTVGNVTREYLYDGWNVISETVAIGNQQSAITNYYTWGLDISGTLQGAGGVGGLLLVATPDGVYAPTCDAHGNISEYIQLATGSITAHLEYDAFGRAIVSDGTAPAPFGFSTKYTDDETGLVYYGYRYYSPELGRWLSRDPIGERGGVNNFQFVYNYPLSFWDDLGEQPNSLNRTNDEASATKMNDFIKGVLGPCMSQLGNDVSGDITETVLDCMLGSLDPYASGACIIKALLGKGTAKAACCVAHALDYNKPPSSFGRKDKCDVGFCACRMSGGMGEACRKSYECCLGKGDPNGGDLWN